ncbi:unnamed protein product [Mortierella alpina]
MWNKTRSASASVVCPDSMSSLSLVVKASGTAPTKEAGRVHSLDARRSRSQHLLALGDHPSAEKHAIFPQDRGLLLDGSQIYESQTTAVSAAEAAAALGSCIHLADDDTADTEAAGGMVAGVEEKSDALEDPEEFLGSLLLSPAPSTLRKCQSAHVYFLDHYIDLLGYLKARRERLRAFKSNLQRDQCSQEESERAWSDYCTVERTRLRQRRIRTQAIQFQILTQIGQGGFGEVFLARKTDTSELCALKRMSKKRLHLQDEVHHIMTERDVLRATRSEWHVGLLYSFQDPECVYLAMEFVPGGDVRTMLTARGVLQEKDATLYFAEMVMAIDALHQQGYIHRDLKPENFLIDRTGHLKLTDFGLSKGQLAESRIEALKAKLKEVKDSMEPTVPVLRRGGGSSMVSSSQQHAGGLEHGLEGGGVRVGVAGGSFASLNGILHRSPSTLLRAGSSSSLLPLSNMSLLNLHTGSTGRMSTVAEQMRLEQQPPQRSQEGVETTAREFRNEGIRRAYSIVGSADYMAPEILASKGYDYGVDYWSLGCILFEFLCGYSPFQADDTRQTCVNVWHWRKVLSRPVYDTEENLEFNLTDDAWDLITRSVMGFMCDDFSTFLEERYTTLRQAKDHPWLRQLDWTDLRSIPSSFVPVLSTPMDTSYFDDFSDPEDMAGYKDVMLRDADLQDAEDAAVSRSEEDDSQEEGRKALLLAEHGGGLSHGSLPSLLRVQDPWRGAFVGFTFRHTPPPQQGKSESPETPCDKQSPSRLV